MKIMTRIVFAVAVLMVGRTAYSQIPRYISYQGILQQSGQPVTGARSTTLTLYGDSLGTKNLFQMTASIIYVNGLFHAEIGPIPAGFDFSKALYLGASIDGAADLLPRTLLTPAPSSFYAEQAGIATTADNLAQNSPDRLPRGAIVTFSDDSIRAGFTYTGSSTSLGGNVWSTPTTTGTFTARYDLTSSVVNGKIYAMGGNNGITVNILEVFDPSTNAWSTPTTTGTFTARYGLTSDVVNGKIYAMGGANSTYLNTLEVFDPSTNTWSTPTTTGTFPPRFLHTSSVVNGKIYAIGGSNGGNLTPLEVFVAPLMTLFYFNKN
jgi:hypothetical protein